MLDLVFLIVPSIAMTILGLVVILRNTHDKVNQLFGILVATSVIWFIINYLSNHVANYNALLATNRVTFVVSLFLIQATWLLSIYFPRHFKKHPIQKAVTYVVTPIIFFLILFTSYIVSSITYISSNQVSEVNSGSLYWLYTLVTIIYLAFLSYNFYQSYHDKQANRLEKQQIGYVSVGFIISFLWIEFAAEIIPSITHNWEISKFAAIGSLFVVVFLSYAIIRHKLFDIKLLVARSFAYFLTLTFIALIIIVPVVLISTRLLHIKESDGFVAVLIVITFVIAFVFQRVRNVFNNLTNKIFYRNYYEPQEVLDKLSNVLVGSVEVEYIKSKTKEILSDAIKPSALDYLLLAEKRTLFHDSHLIKILDKTHDSTIITDEVDQTRKSELYKSLRNQSIAAVMRLRTTKEDLGFIFLGYKQSGDTYTQNDKQLMSISADAIAIGLQNALRFEEIQKFNTTLQEKIDLATHQLRKVNERLKELDETKDDFISMASHQLRTPLTIIKGYVKMVNDGDAGKVTKEQKTFLSQAASSAETMVGLVSDLLNVSRITSGKFSIELSPTNLVEIVEKEINQLSNMAQSKKIQLKFEKPKDFPLLLLDEEKISQVIVNFIDNAIHYSKPTGGEINVQLTHGDDIEFKVIDNGIGVPESDKKKLFAKFYRAKNAIDTRPDGTGIGIYLAKVIITEQGGDIIFDSTPNVGSTFGFKFNNSKIIREQPKTDKEHVK